MKENYFQIGKSLVYIRHSELKPKRKTLLFLNGIGDSSISYLSFLCYNHLSQFNILIPDLLGYGKSSTGQDYSFEHQVKLIVNHLMQLSALYKVDFDDVNLVAHSMAGIHAMLLCNSELKAKIKSVINVEGSITQYGSFISEKVATLSGEEKFDLWFHDFKENFVFKDFINQFPLCRSYYSSLCFCDPRAFLQNALEIYAVCHQAKGKFTNIAGRQFADLQQKKIYCYGDKSLCAESQSFLQDNHLSTRIFNTDNHFVMQQCFDEFCKFIVDWLLALPVGK